MRTVLPALVLAAAFCVPVAVAQAGLQYTPQHPAPGDMVQFHTPHADAVEWTFGDGTTSLERDPAHTYPYAGIYTVTLRTASGNHTTELRVALPSTAYSELDEEAYRALQGNQTDEEGNETEPEVFHDQPRKKGNLFSNPLFSLALVLVVVGLPGLGLVLWKRRRDNAWAQRYEAEDDGDFPDEAYDEEPGELDLDELLPLPPEPDDAEPAHPVGGPEEEDLDPFRLGEEPDEEPPDPVYAPSTGGESIDDEALFRHLAGGEDES